MRRLATIVLLATMLLPPAVSAYGGGANLPLGTLDASAGDPEPGEPAEETPLGKDGDKVVSEKLHDFHKVWTAAVAAIGVILIVGMVRTSREHEISANATQGHDVSRDE